jgi:hypothetical protein
MLFAAQEDRQNFARVFHGVIEIYDLNSGAKTISSHIGQSRRAINEQDNLRGQRKTAPDRLLAQHRAELVDGAKGGDIGGGLVVANRVPLFILFVPSEVLPIV